MNYIGQLFLVIVFLIGTSKISAQNVDENYLDGEIYFKIKNDVLYAFDTTKSDVSIENTLPFMVPFIGKYEIEKVKASFYFSRSENLKRTFRIYFRKAAAVKNFLADLKKMHQVDYAEQVPIMRSTYTPDDIGTNTYAGQYNLHIIRAQDAWNVTRGSATVKIAVVDDAIDINHPDLAGNVILSRDVADDDNDPTPPDTSFSHGTHTAGIACANTNNTIGIASIGFNCKLIAIKATANASGPGFITHGNEGITWAVANGASVVSCSWGNNSYSTTGQNVIDFAYASNVVIVAAAGNDNTNAAFYPSYYNHVISVASTDAANVRAGSSNYGSGVDIAAPGVSVYSLLPSNGYNDYGIKGGTSMAAPLVAGVCGLIRSLNPFLSVDDVRNCIVSTADNIDAQNPTFIGQLGSGRINAFRAVQCNLVCNSSINLGSANYTTPKTESAGIITSANTIPNTAYVILDAATRVILKPGFKAVSGSYFNIYNDGCGGQR